MIACMHCDMRTLECSCRLRTWRLRCWRARSRAASSRSMVGINTSAKIRASSADMDKAYALLWDNVWYKLLIPGTQLGVLAAAVLLGHWGYQKRALKRN